MLASNVSCVGGVFGGVPGTRGSRRRVEKQSEFGLKRTISRMLNGSVVGVG